MADDDKETTEEPEMAVTDADEGGDTSFSVADLVEQLKEHQIDLGDGVSAENFLERLHVALRTAKATKDGEEGNGGELKPEEEPVEMMAQTKFALETRDKQIAALRGRFILQEKQRLQEGLAKLAASGRATKAEIDEQRKVLSAVPLSLDASGAFADHPVSFFLKYRETLPAGTLFPEKSRIAMLGLTPEPGDPVMLAQNETLSDDELEKFLARNGYAKAS